MQAVTIRWWQRLWTTQVHTGGIQQLYIYQRLIASFSRVTRARCWAHGKPVLPSFLYSLPSPLTQAFAHAQTIHTQVWNPCHHSWLQSPSCAYLQRNHLTVLLTSSAPWSKALNRVSLSVREQSWNFPDQFQGLSSPPQTHLSHFFSDGFCPIKN